MYLENIASNTWNNRRLDRPTAYVVNTLATCQVCSANHFLYQCNKFKELDVERKHDTAKRARVCFNPFSGERRYIVAYAMAPYSSHCEKALSQNKFIKRYKGSNFIAKEFKKLFLGLTFCYILCWLVPRLCIRWSDKVETRHGIVSWNRNANYFMIVIR